MKKRFFTLIELLIVVAVITICTMLLTPMFYFGYSTWKEAQMYEQFQAVNPDLLVKEEFVNILDRHPDGAFPVDPKEKKLALQLSRELRAVVDGVVDLEDTKYLKDWLQKGTKDAETE